MASTRLAASPRDAGWMAWWAALLDFGQQQALSCIFPCLIFLTLALSRSVHLPRLARYDLILLLCLAGQAALYCSGLETRDELKVICVFHLLGLALELFKTRHGSWAYPEPALTKLAGVPLYSGFMYASVASYMCQAWRRLRLVLHGWPSGWWTWTFSAAVYLNFFSHHYLPDVRWPLIVLMAALFAGTRVTWVSAGRVFGMPLVPAFLLIGGFVWLAENIATFFGAWQYPDQQAGWRMVHASKITSWFLLVVISFVIVAQLKHVKAGRQRREHRATNAILCRARNSRLRERGY